MKNENSNNIKYNNICIINTFLFLRRPLKYSCTLVGLIANKIWFTTSIIIVIYDNFFRFKDNHRFIGLAMMFMFLPFFMTVNFLQKCCPAT